MNFFIGYFFSLTINLYLFLKEKKKKRKHLQSIRDRILVGCRETCRSGTMNNFTYKSDSWLYSKLREKETESGWKA